MRKARIVRIASIAALLFALAACSEDPTQKDAPAAGGEVLEASVSDAMIPLDTLRSQPPLAPKADSSTQTGQGKGSDGDAAGPQQQAGPAEAAPAPATSDAD